MAKEKKRGFILRSAEKLNNAYEKSLEKNDPIYLEPIHKVEAREERVLTRGGIDVYFLLIVIALASFGAVMSYSASFYTEEAETGDKPAAALQLPDGRIVSPSLNDMAPFLDRAEFDKIVNVKF